METDEMRAWLLRAIAERPGSTTRQLAAGLGLSESTTAYHLGRLQREGEARSQVVGRTRCWYSTRAGLCPILRRAIPLLRQPTVRVLAAALDEAPTTPAAVARRAGLPIGPARWALSVLAPTFLVDRRNGKVALRCGGGICLEKAAEAERCDLWGTCPVSDAWRRALGAEAGGLPAPGQTASRR